MKKLLFFLPIIGILFSVASCVDPNTVAIANGTAGSSGIYGPRILEKLIDFNNHETEYYNSSNGFVNSFEERVFDGSGTVTDKDTYTLTYSNGKISQMRIDRFSTTSSAGETKKLIITPVYNSAGNIISYTKNSYDANNVNLMRDIGEITYNASSKPTKIFEKHGVLNFSNSNYVYLMASNVIATYSGANVTKVEYYTGTYDVNSNSIPSPVLMSLTEYSQFDSQPTPYSTFSKDLRICMLAFAYSKVDRFSDNNPFKRKVTAAGIPIEITESYQYDSQGYPVKSNEGKYSYKAL